MDETLVSFIIKIIVFLPFVILLIYLSLKYGGGKLQSIQNGKHIKILERVPLSKENALFTVKIGEKGYVISSTSSKVEILLDVGEDELSKIQQTTAVPQYKDLNEMYQKITEKLKMRKGGNHE
ncbi:MAG: flagellar biosynthetic protein FliO [Bacillota bacterium]|nr:flagellar biosynthetic protein FliO [Bacillota bacterium]